MARTRLRDARTPDQELELYRRTYPDGYRHTVWPDHVERVNASVEFLTRWVTRFDSVADLSCGDGAIPLRLAGQVRSVYLGDMNGVRDVPVPPEGTGTVVHVLPPAPLPEALTYLPQAVDVLILSETLEHVDDPDTLLRTAANRARYLFVSTPVNERPDSGNLEHYWSWSVADVSNMLMDTGWLPLEHRLLVPESTRHLEGAYHYQLWLAVAQ